MYNGGLFKCYIPKKINKGSEVFQMKNLKETVDEELAMYLLRENSKMCYNSSFKEWFYKLCPFNNVIQMLSYKKKNQDGIEYSEIFSLGVKNSTDFNIEEYYKKNTKDLESVNLPKIPYIVVNDKVIFYFTPYLLFINVKNFKLINRLEKFIIMIKMLFPNMTSQLL